MLGRLLRRLAGGSALPRGAPAPAEPPASARVLWLYGHRSSLFPIFAPTLVHAPGLQVAGIVAGDDADGLASADFDGRRVPVVSGAEFSRTAGGAPLVHFLDDLAGYAALEALQRTSGCQVQDMLAALEGAGRVHTYVSMAEERAYAMASAATFARVRQRLGDARSHHTLDARVEALVALERSALLSVRLPVEVEYFNAADPQASLVPPRGGTYVDVGAAHGDTVERYVAACGGDFRGIHAFEPTAGQFRQLAARWSADARVRARHAAVGEVPGRIPFFDNPAAPFGSNALTLERADGATTVDCVRLDDEVDTCTLIKLDVEGFECAVLRGAARLIGEGAPDLAIACYHYPADLADILDTVESLHRYRHVALRHHGPSLFDSVLLFSDRQAFGRPG